MSECTLIVEKDGPATIIVERSAPKLIMDKPEAGSITVDSCSMTMQLEPAPHGILTIDAQSSEFTLEPVGTPQLDIEATIVLGAGGSASALYSDPYFFTEDDDYFYASWRHVDGAKWKANRYEKATLATSEMAGTNPQPQTVAQFQSIDFG